MNALKNRDIKYVNNNFDMFLTDIDRYWIFNSNLENLLTKDKSLKYYLLYSYLWNSFTQDEYSRDKDIIDENILNGEIKILIGVGGFGKVFKILNYKGETYIEKIIIADKDEYFGYKRELKILSQIKEFCNPYLICLTSHKFFKNHKSKGFKDKDNIRHLIIRMPNIENSCTLDEISANITLNTKLYITHQLLLGLYQLHSLGITHNDIKSDNILVSKEGVRYIDFGISVSETDKILSKDKHILYSKFTIKNIYSIARWNVNTIYKTDIFMLGLMLYILFFGTSLYDKELTLENINYHIQYRKYILYQNADLICNFLQLVLIPDWNKILSIKKILEWFEKSFDTKQGKIEFQKIDF